MRTEDEISELTHACPPRGEHLTPCCRVTPFELPRTDRMTERADLVTCREAEVADLRRRLDEAEKENERLTRRLWPSQGESYANEVERQRYIIDTIQTACERYSAELAVERAKVEAVEKALRFIVGVLSNADGYFLPDEAFDGLVGEVFRAIVDAGCDPNDYVRPGAAASPVPAQETQR